MTIENSSKFPIKFIMTSAGDLYKKLIANIPPTIKLVAVSKNQSTDRIMELYNDGQRFFGESKAQELVKKYELLPKDIQWHMIGHLQTNKVKYISPFVSLIHSVDSLKLLTVINKEAIKNNRVIDCLLQVHIAMEETKYGFDADELDQMLQSDDFKSLKNISIKGLMSMATFTSDQTQIKREFQTLIRIFDRIKSKYFANEPSFCEKSLGMSNDYQLAIAEGSTLLRIGSLIFEND